MMWRPRNAFILGPEKHFMTASQVLRNAKQSLLRDQSCGAANHLLPKKRMFLCVRIGHEGPCLVEPTPYLGEKSFSSACPSARSARIAEHTCPLQVSIHELRLRRSRPKHSQNSP